MTDSLKDKVAIVTGSSSGIGEAIAINFASKGAKVTLCGRDQTKLKSALDKVVKASDGHKDRFITVAGDLKDQKFREEIVKQTVSKFGQLDILVANAGVSGKVAGVRDVTEETYNEVMDTNVKSVLFLIKEAIPHLEKTKGNIINISSGLSQVPLPFGIVYCTSKAALEHLTNCLAVDLGAKGIRVNSVLPGYIPTTDLARHFDADKREEGNAFLSKKVEERQPLKQRDLGVNDIADTVAFLASDAAGSITGEHIKVDCGGTFGGTFS